MNLLEAMGLDPENFTWAALGLCTGLDNPDYLYDDYESDKTVARQVDEMCLSCPVFKQCADAALKNREQGVWAAVYWDGTGSPDKNRNAHKTEETWKRIKQRLTE